MTGVARATVTYGLHADAYAVARAADRALSGSGAHVWYDSDSDTVWITGRNRAIADAEEFGPGQQLIVTHDDGWRIEPAPARAVAP